MRIIYIFDGLGNQMFQYAFYKKMKKIYKNVYGNIDTFNRDMKIHNGYELNRVFGIEVEEKNIIFDNFFSRVRLKKITIFHKIIHKILKELNFIVYIENWSESIEEKLNKKGIVFYNGWWQSEKFFKDISEEIRKDFTFSKFMGEKNLEISKRIKNSNSISIHIRRGDYLGDKGLGGLAPLEYYRRAIEYIKTRVDNPYFFIFLSISSGVGKI